MLSRVGVLSRAGVLSSNGAASSDGAMSCYVSGADKVSGTSKVSGASVTNHTIEPSVMLHHSPTCTNSMSRQKPHTVMSMLSAPVSEKQTNLSMKFSSTQAFFALQ